MLGQREKGLQEAGRGLARASPGLLASVSIALLRRGGNRGSGGAEACLRSADRNSGARTSSQGPSDPGTGRHTERTETLARRGGELEQRDRGDPRFPERTMLSSDLCCLRSGKAERERGDRDRRGETT